MKKIRRITSRACIVLCFVLAACSGGGGDGGGGGNPTPPAPTPPAPAIGVQVNQITTDCTAVPGATEVTAFVSVIDQNGYPVTAMTKDNFLLTEDGINIAPDKITASFIQEMPIPVSVSIVMDYSKSIVDNPTVLKGMEASVIDFVNTLGDDDEAEIIKFSLENQVVQPWTSDKQLLTDAITAAWPPAGGNTSVYDAVYTAVTEITPAANRKAVVILTDGRDHPGSVVSLDDVITYAVGGDVPVFVISLGDEPRIAELQRLAAETGGIFYKASTLDDLDTVYAQIATIIQLNQYVITYDTAAGANAPVTLTVKGTLNGLEDADTKQFVRCP